MSEFDKNDVANLSIYELARRLYPNADLSEYEPTVEAIRAATTEAELPFFKRFVDAVQDVEWSGWEVAPPERRELWGAAINYAALSPFVETVVVVEFGGANEFMDGIDDGFDLDCFCAICDRVRANRLEFASIHPNPEGDDPPIPVNSKLWRRRIVVETNKETGKKIISFIIPNYL